MKLIVTCICCLLPANAMAAPDTPACPGFSSYSELYIKYGEKTPENANFSLVPPCPVDPEPLQYTLGGDAVVSGWVYASAGSVYSFTIEPGSERLLPFNTAGYLIGYPAKDGRTHTVDQFHVPKEIGKKCRKAPVTLRVRKILMDTRDFEPGGEYLSEFTVLKLGAFKFPCD
jgi:hypothetical protein